MNISNCYDDVFDWNPQRKARVGRLKRTWRRSNEEEMKTAGTTWGVVKKVAQN